MDHDPIAGARLFRLTPAAARTACRHGLRPDDPVRAIAVSTASDQDALGRHRFAADVRGTRLRVVLAATDPYLIVAVELLDRPAAAASAGEQAAA